MLLAHLARSSLAAAVATVLTGALPVTAAAQRPATSVAGVWIDHTGQGAVEIGPCAELGGNPRVGRRRDRVCGRVVWLKNPEHRSRSGKRICGAQILGDLRRQSATAWEEGWIYNPEDEERFSASLELANANTLMVTGYLGIKLFGETFTWKRATARLERCTADADGASVR